MKSHRWSLILKLAVVLLGVDESHSKVAFEPDPRYCAIRINGGLAEPQPLFLCPRNGEKEFYYPIEAGMLHLVAGEGETFRIACPGSRFNLKGKRFNDTYATCVGENYFYIRDADIEETFDRISCEKYPNYIARRTDRRCIGGIVYEIGFQLDDNISDRRTRDEFYTVIDLCHDEHLAHTIYAHSTIRASIDAAQKSFPRTTFRKGIFFPNVPINKIYGREVQRDTIAQILDSTELAKQYVPEKGTSFLARGHLVAKTDFIYGSQQRATFFYANAVPMWQNVNSGNWKTMEENVRLFASKRDLDLEVWTGSIGILRLDDEDGQGHEIYLHVDSKNGHAVPVPKILFKLVYSPAIRAGIVFITANNPFLKTLPKDYQLCNDICYKIDYVKWKPDNAERGLSYCCEIDDFQNAFPNLPCFGDVRLLL